MPKLGPPEEGSLLHSIWSGNLFNGNLFSGTPTKPSEQVIMCKRFLHAGDVTGTIKEPKNWYNTTYTYSTLDPSDGSYKLRIKDSCHQCEYQIRFQDDNTVLVKLLHPEAEPKIIKLKTEARNGEQTLYAIAGFIWNHAGLHV